MEGAKSDELTFTYANWRFQPCEQAFSSHWKRLIILSKEGSHRNYTVPGDLTHTSGDTTAKHHPIFAGFATQKLPVQSLHAKESGVNCKQLAGNEKMVPFPLAKDPLLLMPTPLQPTNWEAAPLMSADLLHAAFQIHNGPAQYLAAALMRLRLCERYISENTSRAHTMLRESLACVQAALDTVRATIDTLRFPQATSGALNCQFHAMVERMRSTCTARFYEDIEDVGTLPQAMAVGLAEIGFEALTNAVKHAGARHITVGLRRSRDAVILEVMDNGKGFNWARMTRRRRGQAGVGLLLMRGQANLLGGTFSIKSACPRGTLVRAVVSVPGRSGTVPRKGRSSIMPA